MGVCCVPNCKSQRGKMLHRFPKDPENLKRWLDFVQREDLVTLDFQRLRSRFRVCRDHFSEDSYFPGCRNKTTLKHQAYPTLYPIVCDKVEDIKPNQETDCGVSIKEVKNARVALPRYTIQRNTTRDAKPPIKICGAVLDPDQSRQDQPIQFILGRGDALAGTLSVFTDQKSKDNVIDLIKKPLGPESQKGAPKRKSSDVLRKIKATKKALDVKEKELHDILQKTMAQLRTVRKGKAYLELLSTVHGQRAEC